MPGAIDGSAVPGAMERVLNRMGKAAAKEFQGRIGISNETFQTLRDAKFFRQGGVGPLETVRAFNEILVGGSAAAVDLAVRASFAIQNALAAGGGQVAREFGGSDAMASRLERDLRLLNQIVSVVAVEGAPGAATARAGRRPVSPPRRSRIAGAVVRTATKIPGNPSSVLGKRLRGHLKLISDPKTSDAAISLVSGGRIRKQGRGATDRSNIIIEKHGDLSTAARAFDDAVRDTGGDPSKVPWIIEESRSPIMVFAAPDGTEFKLQVVSSSVSGRLPTVEVQMRARLKNDTRRIKIRYSLAIPAAGE